MDSQSPCGLLKYKAQQAELQEQETQGARPKSNQALCGNASVVKTQELNRKSQLRLGMGGGGQNYIRVPPGGAIPRSGIFLWCKAPLGQS
jgi:hypothetical protein